MSLKRLYRRLRFGEPIIVVSGLPRSGTSMAMKMLEAGGLAVTVDGIRTADEDNPKGYYEDERVKNLARDPDKSWLTRSRGRVIKVISYLLKELPGNNNYRVIFMRRELEEVLASQAKMLDRRGEDAGAADEKMREHFTNDLWKANYQLKHKPHFESVQIAYTDVLADPRGQAERINEFLGGGLDVDRMAGVVDESLYRNRAAAAAPSG
jgi:hypothetical protein